PPAREFKAGETFRYLGKQYRLRIILAPAGVSWKLSRPAVKLLGAWLTVKLSAGAPPEDRGEGARRALVSWYRRRAAGSRPRRAPLGGARLGPAAPPVLVREPRARWGSCDPRGNLRLN